MNRNATIRKGYRIERAQFFLSMYLLFLEIFVFVRILFTEGFNQSASITFMRIGFIFLALIVDVARKNGKLYIPGIKEMSNDTYWSVVNFLVMLHSALRFYFEYQYSPVINYFQAISLTIALIWVVTLYHQKPWITQPRLLRRKRIEELRRKAKITKDELLIIQPLLIKEANTSQKPPFYWRITRWILAFLFGCVISVYSDVIVTAIQNSAFVDFIVNRSIP